MASYLPKAKRKNNYMQNELLMGGISQITQNNQIAWKCNLRNTEKTKFNAIKGHMAIKHCETTHKKMYCPYCNKEINI